MPYFIFVPKYKVQHSNFNWVSTYNCIIVVHKYFSQGAVLINNIDTNSISVIFNVLTFFQCEIDYKPLGHWKTPFVTRQR